MHLSEKTCHCLRDRLYRFLLAGDAEFMTNLFVAEIQKFGRKISKDLLKLKKKKFHESSHFKVTSFDHSFKNDTSYLMTPYISDQNVFHSFSAIHVHAFYRSDTKFYYFEG